MSDPTAPPPPALPDFATALRWWFKLGCISFGGPAGQIAVMHRELVENRRWISERRFLHALNYCMLLPGPEAQQLATYIGWLMHGFRGGVAAGGLFVLPSLFILVGLSWLYVSIGPTMAASLLYGVKPAVLAVVTFAAWRIGSRVLRQPLLWALGAASFVALLAQVPFPLVVGTAALVGWIFRERIRAGGAHAAARSQHGPALIDDHTPIPAHAQFSVRRLVVALATGAAFTLAALALLVGLLGGAHTLTEMGLFFTKAALLTFGGAYAVMPYVFQGAVETHGWLTTAQMMDGLALGETTPGPLIMVVSFVGFVGAWTHAAGTAPLAAGIAGACVATFFTFLPSFVFIFAGAPWVEHTREEFRLAGPLTAITAAVVGAILSLAVFFAGHVLWPHGFGKGFDGFVAVVAIAAGVALYRNWLGMIPTIGVCALVGIVWGFLPF
jgi:chromate transporter